MTGAYYNENDPFAAAWLRELIKERLIADGKVDERDIRDVRPDDLKGFIQCHFFAGIGGWSYALRLAGWPDDRPIWTGSCPCQPFSSAGRGHGESDARHLWPVWYALIAECQPAIVVGEQAAGKGGWSWLDAVSCDLEDEGYAVASIELPSACVGAPHARQRLYFVGDSGWPDSNSREQSFSGLSVGVGRQRFTENYEALFNSARSVWAGESRPALLADGVSGRVAKVRGFGNAIVPYTGATFIQAYCEARGIGTSVPSCTP